MSLDSLFEKAFYDEKMQQQFFYELLINDIYMIATKDTQGSHVVAGDRLKVFSLTYETDAYIPLFLSMNALEHFLGDNEHAYMKANATDLLEALKENHIVINPGQEDSIVLYSDEIKGLLQQGLH